jgi:hypothetical protein|tara:strand:- start:152 stop:382 length:231 start_codon:yes stop_codon:yes gene_type:complete
LKKKALTKKEIDRSLAGLSYNDQILDNKILQINSLFSLYLEYRQTVFKEEMEKFNEFVTSKAKEFEQQQSENKEGT